MDSDENDERTSQNFPRENEEPILAEYSSPSRNNVENTEVPFSDQEDDGVGEDMTETARDREIDQLEKNALEKHGAFNAPDEWNAEEADVSEDEDFETKYNLDKFIGELDAEDEEAVPPVEEDDSFSLTEDNIDKMIAMLSSDNGDDEEEQEIEKTPGVTESSGAVKKEIEEIKVTSATTDNAEVDEVIVLGPEHPKMKRFQKALEDHLRKQIYQAECQTRELENEIKLKKGERDEKGNHLYSLQFELARQAEIIEKSDQELFRLAHKREVIDKKTEAVQTEHVEIKKKLLIEQENEKAIARSVKQMDAMEWCAKQAAEEYDGELMIRQLIDDKIQKIRVETEIQKRDQDFYLDKVLTHVQQMEQTNAGIQRQIQAHIDEQKDLMGMIAEAVTEIEALQMEKNHLQRAWNDTISVVRARDDALNGARETLRETKEKLKSLDGEARVLTKAIVKEQEKHENLTVMLRRRRMEEKILNRQFEKVEADKNHIAFQLNTLEEIRLTCNEELVRANATVTRKEKRVHEPRRKLEKLKNQKAKIEDDILNSIQQQTTLNKAASHITGKVTVIRNKLRSLEADLVKVENDMTLITVEVEELRGQLVVKTFTLENYEKKITEQEKMLMEQQLDLKHSDRIIQKKTSEVEILSKKLLKLIEAQGGAEVGPLEKEMDDLEKSIVLVKENCIELQEDWLKKQDELVQLTTDRDKLLHKNDILRKEVFIMERKKQRVESELDKKALEIVKLKKATDVVRLQIMQANCKLSKDIIDSTELERNNTLLEYELGCMLREAEKESLELQQDIEAMEEEKEALFRTLQESHEQCLQWEKKVRMAKELKNSLKVEQEGNAAPLKLAIHHMQVRYNELRRAQERLMTDMERSIEKRDRIIQQADFTLKRANIHPKQTKLNIQRSFNQLREKTRKHCRDARDAEAEVEKMRDNIETLKVTLEEETKALEVMKNIIKESDDKINSTAVQKHKNLIEVILRQQKYKILEAIKLHRYKPSMKSANVLAEELQKIENKCMAVLELSELLSHEYPEAQLHIKLIRASLLPQSN